MTPLKPLTDAVRSKLATGIACLALLAMSGLVPVALADPPPGKGNPNNSNTGNPGKGNGSGGSGNTGISQSTANLITAGITLAAARALAIDVGAVGFKPLPPGIAKNLARGKPLPPGIATRSLPNNLLKGLPKYDGYEWLAAGTDLILINAASRVVADVLTGALQ